MKIDQLETKRLVLRHWKESDRIPFAEMSADPESMKYLGGTWNKKGSDAFIDRANQHFKDHGYGSYAVELKENEELIGFISLKKVSFEANFTPAVEIGWRLSKNNWGKGYATEGARQLLSHGFNELQLKKIVSYVTPKNTGSVKVMENIGMKKHNETFMHPQMEANDPLAEMVVYSIKRTLWHESSI